MIQDGDAKEINDSSLKPFFLIWGGQAFSLIGSYAVQFALIWWITVETGSATLLAIAGFLGLGPTVLLGPVFGAMVDRWNRKRLMLLSDGAIAVVSGMLAVGFTLGLGSVPLVMTALLVRGVGGALHQPAMAASTTLMVPAGHLTQIQGLNQALQGGLSIVGAPLGALLVATLPMWGVMGVDVISALVAIIPLSLVHVPQPERSDDASETTGLYTDILRGFAYLRGTDGHLALLGLVSWVNLLLVPAMILLPLFVRDELGGGPLMMGGLESLFGVGLLAGGITLGVWGGTQRKMFTALPSLALLGLAVIGLGLVPGGSAGWAFAAIAIVGVAAPLVNGPIQALLQEIVPADYQGRVFALYGSLAGAMTPLGLAFAGPAAELLGTRGLYIAGGISCIVVALVALGVPAIRALEENQPDIDQRSSTEDDLQPIDPLVG